MTCDTPLCSISSWEPPINYAFLPLSQALFKQDAWLAERQSQHYHSPWQQLFLLLPPEGRWLSRRKIKRVVRNQYAVMEKVGEKGKGAKHCMSKTIFQSSSNKSQAVRRQEVKVQWYNGWATYGALDLVLFFPDIPYLFQRGCPFCCASQSWYSGRTTVMVQVSFS